jgi:hypothetical protein
MKRYVNGSLWVFVVLVIVSILTMIMFDRPLIRGDNTAYLAWIDTFVRDRDIDLANQYERFQPVNSYQIAWDADLGRYVDIFPFGVVFLQGPFYAVGGVLVRLGIADQNPDYFLQMQGVNQGYSLAMMFGANLMMLAAIVLSWRMARHFTDSWTGAALAWGFFMGTPLIYYSTISPLNSHNPGAFLVSCLLFLLMVRTNVFDRRYTAEPKETPLVVWIALGVIAGLMTLVRWQLLMAGGWMWALLLWQRNWKGLLITGFVAAVVMLPLPLVWNEMFGKPFVVPYDETTHQNFLRWPVNSHRVFWEMLIHSPILFLSLAGIPFLWRLDRKLTLFCLAVIGSEILINGATCKWCVGDAYGERRMSELYSLYIVMAAALIARWPAVRDRLVAWRAVLTRAALVGLIAYSIFFLMAFMVFSWTNPHITPAGNRQFADEPDVMIEYFFDHPDPLGVIKTIFRTHLGPRAWDHPGP